MESVTWLHLSDLHYCEQINSSGLSKVIEDLISDLKKLEKEKFLSPDMIFFTGDLAFGNDKNKGCSLEEQYKDVANFLERIRTSFSKKIEKENIFIVPGNHDVDLSICHDAYTSWLDNEKNEKEIDNLIKNKCNLWKDINKGLSIYHKFLADSGYAHLIEDPERLVYSKIININGYNLGIAGFNSAWSCFRTAGAKKSKVFFGAEWQINNALNKLKNADFKIALIHHPPSWFAKVESNYSERKFQEEFEFLLHGHEHDDWVTEFSNGHVKIAAGSIYSRFKETGYNIVKLDYENHCVNVWLRKYIDKGKGGWVPDELPGKTQDGVLSLENVKKWIERLKNKSYQPAPIIPDEQTENIVNDFYWKGIKRESNPVIVIPCRPRPILEGRLNYKNRPFNADFAPDDVFTMAKIFPHLFWNNPCVPAKTPIFTPDEFTKIINLKEISDYIVYIGSPVSNKATELYFNNYINLPYRCRLPE